MMQDTPPAARWAVKLAALSILSALYGAGAAHAAVTCTLTATSVNLTYTSAANANASGNITLNCTRALADPNSTTYWVSIDNGTAGARRVFRHGGGTTATDRLNVSIFKNATTTSWTATGTARVSGTLNFGTSLTASTVLTYDLRVASGQTGKTAGIYDEIFTASLQLTTAGAVVATTTFTPTVSIVTQCFVGQVASGNTAPGAVSPSAINLNYTSFSASAQSASMGFTVDCTRGTPYSLALSPASGTLLGLAYTLGLSGASATGTGLAQPYTVTADVPAGQSGTCALATCTATQNTVLTITY